MSATTFGLPPALRDYMVSVSVREPPLLARLREETSKLPMAMMQISPEQGQLLALLVRATRARQCLEVGVFTGYSSLSVASALPQDGKLVACDVSEEWTSIARRYWHEAGVADKIDLRLGSALVTLDEMISQGHANTYDFAFIDADKTNYSHYFERALMLIKPGGLIGVDNTLWYGRPADPEQRDADTMAIRQFNARLHGDQRVDLSLIPIGDGMTLAWKRPTPHAPTLTT